MSQPYELTTDQWKRRALRAEGAMRHALWMSPLHYPKPETADEMAKRFRMHIEATYPDLIVRYDHQPVEVWKYTEDCGCQDDGSAEYENDHCEEADDGYLCSRSFLGKVCSHCEDEEGDGPDWSPDRVEWPCQPIREINAQTDAAVLAAAMGQPAATALDHGDYPLVADKLPAGTIESAVEGASMLDANAGTPYGRNVLAHALVRLQRDGWLRDAPEWFDAASRPSGDR